MTDRQAAEARELAELRQMLSAPSDAYSAGAWCEAANCLLAEVDALSVRLAQFEALTDSLEAILFGDNQSRDRDELEARAAELVAADVRLAQAEQERDGAKWMLATAADALHDAAWVMRGAKTESPLPQPSTLVLSQTERVEKECRAALEGHYEDAVRNPTKRAERAEVRLREYEKALKAVFEVAAVAHEGDPWYCENEGVDAEAAFALARPLAAASGGREAPRVTVHEVAAQTDRPTADIRLWPSYDRDTDTVEWVAGGREALAEGDVPRRTPDTKEPT